MGSVFTGSFYTGDTGHYDVEHGFGQQRIGLEPNPDFDVEIELPFSFFKYVPQAIWAHETQLLLADFGCGHGIEQFLIWQELAQYCPIPIRVTGIDISGNDLNKYEQLPHRDFDLVTIVQDIRTLDLPDETFHAGISNNLLHWLGKKEGFEIGLQQMHRVLRRDAILDIVIPSPFNPMNYGEWKTDITSIIDFETGTAEIQERLIQTNGVHEFIWRNTKPVVTLTVTALAALCEQTGFEVLVKKGVKTKSGFLNPLTRTTPSMYEISRVLLRKS